MTHSLHRPRGSGGTNQSCFASRLRCCSSNQNNARLREQCLKEAIALAQQQEAKFWELRATATLAKLRADRRRTISGRCAELPPASYAAGGEEWQRLRVQVIALAFSLNRVIDAIFMRHPALSP